MRVLGRRVLDAHCLHAVHIHYVGSHWRHPASYHTITTIQTESEGI
jgi:hypothetical protein